MYSSRSICSPCEVQDPNLSGQDCESSGHCLSSTLQYASSFAGGTHSTDPSLETTKCVCPKAEESLPCAAGGEALLYSWMSGRQISEAPKWTVFSPPYYTESHLRWSSFHLSRIQASTERTLVRSSKSTWITARPMPTFEKFSFKLS